jgi:LEA14-like dessication related protein
MSILRYAAVVLLSAALGNCAYLYRDLQEPEIRLVGVAPQQISFSGIKLLCRLRVDNPNDVSIPIDGGQFVLEVEGMQLAQGALIDGFKVAAHGRELVDVVVEVDSGNSIALAARLLGQRERELEYALTGYVDVGIGLLGRVHINESGSVPLTGEPGPDAGGDII